MLSGYWNDGVGCSIETLAELNIPAADDETQPTPRLATFTPVCNPRLRAPGDFVSRMLFERIG